MNTPKNLFKELREKVEELTKKYKETNVEWEKELDPAKIEARHFAMRKLLVVKNKLKENLSNSLYIRIRNFNAKNEYVRTEGRLHNFDTGDKFYFNFSDFRDLPIEFLELQFNSLTNKTCTFSTSLGIDCSLTIIQSDDSIN